MMVFQMTWLTLVVMLGFWYVGSVLRDILNELKELSKDVRHSSEYTRGTKISYCEMAQDKCQQSPDQG